MGRTLDLRPRKQPRQARSRQMRADILTAAVRVLRREGALRFTTPRVAAAAGISVGSLYQYFPNKQALVFALHTEAVERAWAAVQRILDHRSWSAREKLGRMARLYFVAESREVGELGSALQDAELYFADQPAERALEARVRARFTDFVQAAVPGRRRRARAERGARLVIGVLEAVGRAAAAMKLPRRELERLAAAAATMVADQIGLP